MKSFVKPTKQEMPPQEAISVESTTTVAGEPPVQAQHDPVADTAVAQLPSNAQQALQKVYEQSVLSSPFVSGVVSASDIKKPYLSCVQAVGPKSLKFMPGTLVIGDTAITPPPTDPKAPTTTLRVVFGFMAKTFVEWLKYDPAPTAPKPKVFTSPHEVMANGGTLEWRGNIQPSYYPRLTCATIIRCPNGCTDAEPFFLMDGDHTYSPVMISFQRTSYAAAKTLLTDLDMSLEGDPTKTFYDISWSRQPRGGNLVWCPTLTRVRDEVPSEALRAKVRGLTGVSADDGFEE